MDKKNERLSLIRKIVSEELIGSQDELIKRLAAFGVRAMQSTLSRDFKELNISKTPHPTKGYIYVLSEALAVHGDMGTSNLGDAVIDVKFSGNLGVITTKSGYASAISVIIDGRKSADVMATVAGDNAIIMILREDARREDVLTMLKEAFPVLKTII